MSSIYVAAVSVYDSTIKCAVFENFDEGIKWIITETQNALRKISISYGTATTLLEDITSCKDLVEFQTNCVNYDSVSSGKQEIAWKILKEYKIKFNIIHKNTKTEETTIR